MGLGLTALEAKLMWQGRNVAVTGATGFLGGWLCEFLLERGANVVALVRDERPRTRFAEHQSRITCVRGALEDAVVVRRMMSKYEVETVFHLGAQALVGLATHDPISTFESNIRGTWNILEAARLTPGVKQLIVASSDKAYGSKPQDLYREDQPLDGIFPYDVSKTCTDLLCRSYHVTYNLPVVVTRCGNFFGGGDLNWSRIVPGTIRSILNGEAPRIRSNGNYIRDYLYVEDAALAYLHLAERFAARPELAGQAFNFSLEQPLKVIDLINTLLKLMNSPLKPVILDLPESRFEIPIQLLSAAKAREQLEWAPRHSMEEGLKRTASWYTNYLLAE